MTALALMSPNEVRVNRSDLRQKQRETLDRARDNTVVVISATDQEEEKLLLDKKYFDELVLRIRSLAETLEITMDRNLFKQIMRSADDLEEQTRLGKLHSFEEAFGEE
ncbi:MAG TPA: hypothetical protein VNZ56_09725 [Verrucomicrobiae bacterium]|nr:hypothetical protein [Verrucomicrobiae bacterium]